MLFNSFEYFLLLAAAVPAYWASPRVPVRQFVLLTASVVFYCSWLPAAIVLLILLVGFNWACAIAAARGKPGLVAIAVAVDLTALGTFKYADFLLANSALLMPGSTAAPQSLGLILPLGISFYVFQMIAYAVDVRRGTVEPERNLLVLFLFIAFFPQLVAGPICRASELLPQLKRRLAPDASGMCRGLYLLGAGLFLKLGIADNLAPSVDRVFANPGAFGSGDAIVATVAFGIQILCDFWGYSTMAVGSALLFGIRVPQNFNLPYFATSLREFWRRWHITLSSWLRDYLYIPLGGGRLGRPRTALNLLVVMTLGGLWHGANWTFVAWGTIHGAWLALEREAVAAYRRMRTNPGRLEQALGQLGGWLATMLVVFIAWVFFRADSLTNAIGMLQQMLGSAPRPSREMLEAVAFIALFSVLHYPLHWLCEDRASARIDPVVYTVCAFWLICGALILGAGTVNEFIYFQF